MPQAARKILPWPPPLPKGELKTYYIDWRNPPKPREHKEIDISVSKQDSVYWFCDKKFRVLSLKPDRDENPKAPYPFYRRFPEATHEGQPKYVYQVNSGPAKPESVPWGKKKGYLYKPVFEFEDGTKFDPHIRTHK
jgi:hypothetical protein